VRRAHEVYSALPGRRAELKLIEGGKHMFSKEHDRLAIGYIRDFLSGEDGACRADI